MAVNDFSNQNIQDTYQRVVQTDGTNVADGTGSLLPISFEGNNVIVPGALKAQSYIVSESIINVSSGSTVFGDSADDSHNFNGAITASGGISSSKIRTGGRVASSAFDIACIGSIDTDGEMSCTGFSNSSTTTLGGRVILTGASAYIETPSYISSSRVFTEHISASGNISASGLTLTKEEKGGIGNYGVDGGLTANGQSTKFQITGIPTIPGRASNKVSKPQPTFIKNNVVKEDSVILVTCTTDELSAVGFGNNTPTAIANKGFFINIGNEAALDFTVTSASFSAVII